jgi:hypothetical protein
MLDEYGKLVAQNRNADEINSSLFSLGVKIKEIDPDTKVKIFSSGQKQVVADSIIKDYEQGEQIIVQGFSAGGGDAQDLPEILKEAGIKDNIITVQIDSIEPFGNDAAISDNVDKAINVFQADAKTGVGYGDFFDGDAMNGESRIRRSLFNFETDIVNKEFKNIQGPSQGEPSSPHRNMDNDPRGQQFIQEQVLPLVEKEHDK